MVLWTGSGPGKINYAIVYIMFSKNNNIDFEPDPPRGLQRMLRGWSF